MAERASRDRVAADMQPPNFRSAVQIIRHAIEKKKSRVQSINKEIGEEWAKVTGFKVNKKAGAIFGMMDKLENEERTDIMRSLNGLIDAAGWDKETADLVDEAEGNVVQLRVGGSSETGGAKGDDDDDERAGESDGDDAEMAEVEAALAEPAKRGRKAAPKSEAAEEVTNRAAEAKAKVAAKIMGKPATDPAEPYTGDNSDLAGE